MYLMQTSVLVCCITFLFQGNFSFKLVLFFQSTELRDLEANPPEGINVGLVGEDMFHWQATIIGPQGSPYAGGIFKFTIDFSQNYPVAHPQVASRTRIYHPNIDNNGHIALHILNDEGWEPDFTISQVLISIRALLMDPNPDYAQVEEIANAFLLHKEQFNETATGWTMMYAMH